MELANSYQETNLGELPPGTLLLQGQYKIKSFLNSGGFGMTYLATDSLNRTVVIKECFPESFCTRAETKLVSTNKSSSNQFRSIVRNFVREAQRLAKLDHPNIVGVHQVFEDNQTAYMALDYIGGQDLLDVLEDKKQYLGPIQIKSLLLSILEAVAYTHSNGLLHRDISPDNILLDKNGEPILIDFGAARESEVASGKALSELLTVKEGYSPQEFYVAGSQQGPFSDLYALGATFYHVISGEKPANSQDRLAAVAAGDPDPYVPLALNLPGYDVDFLRALDKSLQLFPSERIQSAYEWMGKIDASKKKEAALARAQSDESIRLTIRKLVAETNSDLFAETKQEELPDEIAAPTVPIAKARQSTLGLLASLLFRTDKTAKTKPINEVKT
jgi:serine/threonine protein kinase